MTPYQHKVKKEQDKLEAQEAALGWVPTFASTKRKLNSFLNEMEPFKLHQEEVPLIIRLVENPKYKTSKLFTGAVDLFTHDCIHVLLGRGLLPKDEAFVIGYTMGSGKQMARWRRNLFVFCAKYFYPSGYRFGEEERFIFNLAVLAGSQCSIDLSKVDFKKLLDLRISEIRRDLRIRMGHQLLGMFKDTDVELASVSLNIPSCWVALQAVVRGMQWNSALFVKILSEMLPLQHVSSNIL